MQYKFSNCFCMCQIHHIRLLLSDYCIKIHTPITGEGIPGKSQEWPIATFVLAWRQFLRPAEVRDISDHLREPNSLWSDCLITKIKKRQNIVEKNEYAKRYRLTDFEILTFIFSFDFTLSSKTTFLIGISWNTFACIALWCLQTC